jgi:hypothetical protein
VAVGISWPKGQEMPESVRRQKLPETIPIQEHMLSVLRLTKTDMKCRKSMAMIDQ